MRNPVAPDLPRITVQHVPGRFEWVVTEPFVLGDTKIPAGFVFDAASVPRVFWSWVTPAGRAFESACVHDYHYRTQTISKAEADRLLYEHGLAYTGGRWISAYVVWLSVHWFGGRAWRRHGAR